MSKYTYFITCKTIEDVKKAYKELLFKFHPDISTDPNATEICKAINNEYEKAFAQFKNIHENAKGETYTTSTESSETAKEYADIINQIIHFEGCTVEIIGSWIWLSGNTKAYKEQIKAIGGFRWSNNKLSWYYHKEPFHKKGDKKLSLDDIRTMFGSETVQAQQRQAITC